MTDMIEIVARALLAARGRNYKGPLAPYAENSEIGIAVRDARAAIEALRTPTDAMVAEGWQNTPVEWSGGGGAGALPHVWQAMIDAALNVQPGGLERGIPVYRTDGDT